MKKLLFAGALALSTFTFASTKEEAKPEANMKPPQRLRN